MLWSAVLSNELPVSLDLLFVEQNVLLEFGAQLIDAVGLVLDAWSLRVTSRLLMGSGDVLSHYSGGDWPQQIKLILSLSLFLPSFICGVLVFFLLISWEYSSISWVWLCNLEGKVSDLFVWLFNSLLSFSFNWIVKCWNDWLYRLFSATLLL